MLVWLWRQFHDERLFHNLTILALITFVNAPMFLSFGCEPYASLP